MTSLQQSNGGGKAAKFVQANPLDPILRPFADGLNDEQRQTQQVLAENVNNRLTAAMADLQEKHRVGRHEIDHPDRAPTGPAYRQHVQQERERQQHILEPQEKIDAVRKQVGDDDDDDASNSDSDSDYEHLLDDDNHNLESIRQSRLAQLKAEHAATQAHLALGHGQYRTISQDDFLPTCTGASKFVAVHFCKDDFARCQIMDHHLQRIAKQHIECKFVRILAEKAPFFVHKLGIKVLPTLLVLEHGQAIARLTGFQDLMEDDNMQLSSPTSVATAVDSFPTRRLGDWLRDTGAIHEYEPTEEELEHEVAQLNLHHRGGGRLLASNDDDD